VFNDESNSKHTSRGYCTLNMALKRLRLYTVCHTHYSCGGTSYTVLLVISERLTTADRMILFVVAFFAECFHWSHAVPTVPVAVASFIVLMLVMWSWRTLGGSTSECSEHWQWDMREWIKDARRIRRILAVLFTLSTGRRKNDGRLSSSVA